MTWYLSRASERFLIVDGGETGQPLDEVIELFPATV